MTQQDTRLPQLFYAAIEHEIDLHPAGMSEYALITALRARGFFEFLPPPPAAPHLLFRAHFLLFHALYVLKGRLLSSRCGDLTIEALCIRRMPWRAGVSALTPADALQRYYLDWDNLDGTAEQEVHELIASFWKRLGGSEDREAALATLGLEDPVTNETIKMTWRRLAMEHHPDRGGDKQRLQAINAAVGELLDDG